MKTVKRRKPKSKLSDQENRRRAEKDKLESRILVGAPLLLEESIEGASV